MYQNQNVDFEVTKKKLNLVAIEPGRKPLPGASNKVYVSVNNKNGTMNISKGAVEAMAMGKAWMKTSFDVENKIFAWQVRGELDNESIQENGWKVIKVDTVGQVTLSIVRILRLFEMKQESYKHLEVKKYVDSSTIGRGQSYFYVDMKDAELNHPDYKKPPFHETNEK